MRSLVLALLVGACAPPLPQNPLATPPQGDLLAADIARAAWSERLDAPWLADAELPAIQWFRGECLEYDSLEKFRFPDLRDAGCPTGNWFGGGAHVAHVLVRPTISRSALAHEMLHWALTEVSGDPGDHTGAIWDQVSEVNAAIQEAGL